MNAIPSKIHLPWNKSKTNPKVRNLKANPNSRLYDKKTIVLNTKIPERPVDYIRPNRDKRKQIKDFHFATKLTSALQKALLASSTPHIDQYVLYYSFLASSSVDIVEKILLNPQLKILLFGNTLVEDLCDDQNSSNQSIDPQIFTDSDVLEAFSKFSQYLYPVPRKRRRNPKL